MKIIKGYLSDDNAASAVEYALLAAGIALVVMSTWFMFGEQLNATFEAIYDKIGTHFSTRSL